ncbi:helix-turn-helix domain-containing protein [Komagataeibacter europaeus]|uniref:helix-turn-helix domain-containing protein n=1 Tax=Komagataeibacter europaeus TaxID=33995 RepID=UPI0009DA7EE6|nr:helix-turn-helix transcriptional regulator [Komagataeibacter europaeus]GBQ39041.1 hypothetical protein AA18890_0338 [Komagataeibacter europaeus LMG 18890]
MSDKHLTPEEVELNCHTLRFVRPWMRLRGVTQRHLAEGLGMSEPSVSKWLNGKVNMTLSQFVRVAELLKATPEQLLFDPKESLKAARYKEIAELANELDSEKLDIWIKTGKAMSTK